MRRLSGFAPWSTRITGPEWRKLAQQAKTGPLTGLANSRMLEESCRLLLRSKRSHTALPAVLTLILSNRFNAALAWLGDLLLAVMPTAAPPWFDLDMTPARETNSFAC